MHYIMLCPPSPSCSHTPQNLPESEHRADSARREHCKESKVHAAVDTLGDFIAFTVTPANEHVNLGYSLASSL